MRLAFCNKYKDKSAQWWERVMFTDESTFQQVRNCGSNYIRRPSGERYNPKFTVKTVKYPPSVMCWGAITAAGTAALTPIPKDQRVNAAYYIFVLSDKVKLHMHISGTTLFQQDSAPCHTAHITKKWFKDNGIELLEDWPSNSPD